MSLAPLLLIDSGLKLNTVGTVTAASYCVDATVKGKPWKKAGPAATIAAGACP